MHLKCFYLINALYSGVSDLVEGCHIHGLHIVFKGCDQFLQLVCSNFIILHNTGNLQLLDAIADRQQLSCTGEVRWQLVYWNTKYGQNFLTCILYIMTYIVPRLNRPTECCGHTPQAWPCQFRHPRAWRPTGWKTWR